MFHLFTLVSFLALYTSAFSFGFLAFQFIEKAFPDLLNYGRSMMWGGGRNAIAGLIVAFPLYLFLMRLIWKETKGNAKNLESGVRTWFTYITLVVVAGIMLGDLIAVVSSVLGGELAIRFLLKAGTIFAIAGAIFSYYLHDLKRKAGNSFSPRAKACVLAVTVLVLIFIGYGIILTGTPGQQRQLQFDQRRTSDLQQISSAVQVYWDQQKKLPQGFDDLKQQQFTYIESVQDPETRVPYEYLVLGEKTYELCAVFATDSSQIETKTRAPTPFSAEQWNHGIGRTCFAREIPVIIKSN